MASEERHSLGKRRNSVDNIRCERPNGVRICLKLLGGPGRQDKQQFYERFGMLWLPGMALRNREWRASAVERP